MSNIFHISYVINEDDDIVFVSDDWAELAIASNAPELSPEKILNRSLWDFISDDTTREIYKNLIAKVRAGRDVNFDFRCDSPDQRRFSEMNIVLLENGRIQFDSYIFHTEQRAAQNVLQTDETRDRRIIVVCSWCKKVDMRDGSWREIEQALPNLKIFESETVPQVSHGMCADCYHSILEKHQLTIDEPPVK